MKRYALSQACRLTLLAGIAGMLPGTLSATVVHLCSGGTYTQTEIYHAPVPEPGGSWHSTTTVMGPCSREWSLRISKSGPPKPTAAERCLLPTARSST